MPDAGKALPAKQVPVAAPAPTAATAPEPSSGGNSSDQSVGVVQVGPVTADPAPVVADTPVAGAVATTKTTIGNTGGNQSSQSGGVAQVGGDNTATGSVGVVQVSHSKSNTGVAARVVGTHVGADAGGLIGGSGTNTANGSAVAVQAGSGNAANGSTAALQIQPSTAGVGIKADAGPLAPALKTNVSISANEVLGRTLGIDLSRLGASPGPATVFILDIVHALVPGASDEVGLQRLVDLGVLQVGGNGDDVRIDLGALGIKVVSLVRDPQVTVTLFGTTLTAGGLFGVPNTGVPTATDSLGTVQAGGSNRAAGSLGVAQIGSLVAAPQATLRNDEARHLTRTRRLVRRPRRLTTPLTRRRG